MWKRLSIILVGCLILISGFLFIQLNKTKTQLYEEKLLAAELYNKLGNAHMKIYNLKESCLETLLKDARVELQFDPSKTY